MRNPDRPKSGVIFRCAIYTRKSPDDGLEQEFNSLDAQREACEAYVTSQRHAGWMALQRSARVRVRISGSARPFPKLAHPSSGRDRALEDVRKGRRGFSYQS